MSTVESRIRNPRYEAVSTVLLAAAAILLGLQASQTGSLPAKLVLGAIGVAFVLLAIRATASAEAYLTDDHVVIRSLLRTSTIPLSKIERFNPEVGYVNLYRRAYLRLLFVDGTSRRLTQFNRALGQEAVVRSQASALNAALENHRDRIGA